MTKIKIQKKYYLSYTIFLLFTIIFSGCTTNIEKDYDKLSDKKTKIALLLPIGSTDKKLSRIGKSLRDAALLAKEDLDSNLLEINTYDTYGTIESGEIAYNLALEENNEVMVGPYLSSVTRFISNQIPLNNLKIIALSDDPIIVGRNIFILGDTVINRANNLIKYAIKNDKFRFALIGPKKDDNSEIRTLLTNKVKKNGGTVTFSFDYSKNLSEFSDLAQTIILKIKNTNTDVIIFTDDLDRRMSLLAAELVEITTNKIELGVQIISLSNWKNSASLISEPALQRSWFTMPDQRFRKFYENKFIKKFGYLPHPKSHLAYDAIAALGVLNKNSKDRNSIEKFKDIFNTNGFIGIDGIYRFNYDRIAEKELSVIEIINGKPKVLKQARNRFQ